MKEMLHMDCKAIIYLSSVTYSLFLRHVTLSCCDIMAVYCQSQERDEKFRDSKPSLPKLGMLNLFHHVLWDRLR